MVIGGSMETIKISELYSDLPVTITSDDCEKFGGLDLANEIDGDSNERIVAFLDTVHSHIYDFLIYQTGDKDIKNAIIEKYRDRLEKTIKRALVVQAQYLISSNNIELWNGVVKTVNGVDVKDTADIIQKVLAPTIINLLGSTKPNILFAGR